MKESLKNFVFFILFWLLFFAACRLVFILSIISKWRDHDFSSMFLSFFHGFPMDLSAAAYFGIAPLLVWIVLFLFKKNPHSSLPLQIYTITLICLVSVLAVVDFNVFREWGTKLNYRAIHVFFKSPYEVIISSGSSPVLLSLLSGLLLIVSGIFLYRKYKPKFYITTYPGLFLRIVFVLFVLTAEVIMIRGGISTSPLTISSAYYSNNQALNHAAVNTEWNLFRDYLDSRNTVDNPYQYMSKQEAKQVCDSLLNVPDSTEQVLTVKRPNIVLIILESFTADIISKLGGEKEVTPFLDSLIDKGLFFSNFYATGFRTDIGFVSLHTGFPSQPLQSILSIPAKAEKLPSISSSLYQNGYATSFYYGGESDFFNFRAFILKKDYHRLTDIRDFEKKDINAKWGAHDGVVLKRAIEDLRNEPQPFFSTVLTLSNHEPFDLPVESKFPGNDLANKFRSAAFYTDQSLKEFFAAASQEKWYNTTLFIVVADHGHRLPKNESEIYMPQRSHIPLLFFGNVLQPSFKGKVVNRVASQTDLPATVLAQLGIRHNEFYWSKNLMNPFSKEFAFNSYNNGFVWMGKEQQIGFDSNSKKVNYRGASKGSDSLLIRCGQAYLQTVYQEYLSY